MIEEKPEKFVKHVFPLSKSGGPFFTRPKRTSELDHSSALRPASKMVNDPCLGGVVVSLSALSAIATVNAQRGRNRAGPSHKRS